jgi:malate/lactate dehydrogenase
MKLAFTGADVIVIPAGIPRMYYEHVILKNRPD